MSANSHGRRAPLRAAWGEEKGAEREEEIRLRQRLGEEKEKETFYDLRE